MQEKRKYPRIKDKLIVACDMPSSGVIEAIERSEDLSLGGMRISIHKNAIKGDTVNCKIYLFNDNIPIEAKGRIVWKKELKKARGQESDIAGIEFSGLGAEEAKRLRDYISRRLNNSKEGR